MHGNTQCPIPNISIPKHLFIHPSSFIFMTKTSSLYEVTQWICYFILIAGLAVIWFNFWVGVFYSVFGFGVLYAILRREDKNQKFSYLAYRREHDKTHGVG
jgi:predicted membrane protein